MSEVALAIGAIVYLGLAFFLWRQDETIQALEADVERLEDELATYGSSRLDPAVMQEIWDISAAPGDVLAEQRRIREASRENGFRWD